MKDYYRTCIYREKEMDVYFQCLSRQFDDSCIIRLLISNKTNCEITDLTLKNIKVNDIIITNTCYFDSETVPAKSKIISDAEVQRSDLEKLDIKGYDGIESLQFSLSFECDEEHIYPEISPLYFDNVDDGLTDDEEYEECDIFDD